MLTSFFRKSTLPKFLMIFGLALLVFFTANFVIFDQPVTVYTLFKEFGVSLVFLLTLFFSNYILIKDKSRGRHSYVPFLLFLFCLASPVALVNNTVIFSGFFCVLGLRRASGLSTGLHCSRKIFDTVFCFAVASLFFPSAILFEVVPVCAMLYFAPKTYKNWLIPLAAFGSVFVLKTVYDLALTDHFFNPLDYYNSLLAFHKTALTHPGFYVPVGSVVVFGIWAMISFFFERNRLTTNQLRNKYMLVISFFTAVVVVLFADRLQFESGRGQLLLFIPTALIGAKYFENKRAPRLKEILLISLCVIFLGFAIATTCGWI